MLFTVFHLIYACGLRIAEACRLQVRDVDFTAHTLFIRCTKFGKDRMIPFGSRVGERLGAYHRARLERFGMVESAAKFFVHARGHIVAKGSLNAMFRNAQRKAGVTAKDGRPKGRVHDLRHSFAVHRLYKWYLEGADPQERLIFLSLYMGHVDPEYTQHYLHLSQDLLRVAGRPLERDLEKRLPPPTP